ncbi:hypothetical protein ASE14_07460 [Agromyces sp. Root81]|uniref:hypothetical protein n=1 Tax=Agromyces sp. Root81 TaxID=1736601 RepID=UPI0006FBA0C8|nr:hypothetical protein [Agromyces sp. Root81]KRC60801.1 hypothetical protein ASE14_07460 [Agromyces sp. Root81]
MTKIGTTRGIQVDGGWSVDSNAFIDEHDMAQDVAFDDTVLFAAVNGITGESLSLTYENAATGYTLEQIQLSRASGRWTYDEASSVHTTIAAGHDAEAVFGLLPRFLNPLGKDLIPLRLSSWTVAVNNLTEAEAAHRAVELVFSATRGKLFIDVTYTRAEALPYCVYVGMSKHPYTELTYTLDKPTTTQKVIHLREVGAVAALIDDLLTGLEPFYAGVG